MRLLKSMSVVSPSMPALMVLPVAWLLAAGPASAQPSQIWDTNGNLIRFCGEGIDEGKRCESNADCDLAVDDDELGLCDQLAITTAVPGFDDPDVYTIADEFVDLKNLSTMYAWFDYQGLNFAAGYASRTEEVDAGNDVRAVFKWVLGVPTKLRQKEKRNIIDQGSYLAVALTFFSVTVVDGGADIVIPLFTLSDPELAGYPIEVEGCSAKVTVREPTKRKNVEDLSDIRLDTTWRLDCENLPMPPGLACLDGSETCPPDEQVSSEDLLKFFSDETKIKARGKADADLCESWIDGVPVPPDCE